MANVQFRAFPDPCDSFNRQDTSDRDPHSPGQGLQHRSLLWRYAPVRWPALRQFRIGVTAGVNFTNGANFRSGLNLFFVGIDKTSETRMPASARRLQASRILSR